MTQDKLNSEFIAAVQEKRLDAAKSLLEKGADINAYVTGGPSAGLTALHCAVSQGCAVDAAKWLIEQGADINALSKNEGLTPIGMIVASRMSPYSTMYETGADLLKLLLSAEADANLCGAGKEPPLIAAVERRAGPAVNLLLTARVDPNTTDAHDRTALQVLCNTPRSHGSADLVRPLVLSGAHLGLCYPENGDSLAHRVLKRVQDPGALFTALLLFGEGEKSTPVNNNGETWLHAAVIGLQPYVVERYHSSDYFDDPNARDHMGRVPLHCLSHSLESSRSHRQARPEKLRRMVQVIQSLGGDLNLQDHEGNTPLHACCEARDVEGVKGLLASGANPSLPNVEGILARELAMENKEIHRLILQQVQAPPAPAVKEEPMPG